jgi:hypothetical protein
MPAAKITLYQVYTTNLAPNTVYMKGYVVLTERDKNLNWLPYVTRFDDIDTYNVQKAPGGMNAPRWTNRRMIHRETAMKIVKRMQDKGMAVIDMGVIELEPEYA